MSATVQDKGRVYERQISIKNRRFLPILSEKTSSQSILYQFHVKTNQFHVKTNYGKTESTQSNTTYRNVNN